MKSSLPVCIVGAGFSGAVVARQLAEAGIPSVVLDERDHVAGNCHTARCEETGVNVHEYGPHVFHTDKEEVWDFIQRFGEMMPYVSRIKTTFQGKVYSLPINLHTLNQFFGKALRPQEAQQFLASKVDSTITNPESFEEQALSVIGRELYEAFFLGYTRKQWELDPSELPASILKRLPVRFDYNDNYFSHPYQGIPKEGYTDLVKNILDHELIEVRLGASYDPNSAAQWRHTFYSGPIDRYFDFRQGRLGYRTLKFEREVHEGDYLGAAIMNYGDSEVPYTRITEHKHFAPWETHSQTVIVKEYAAQCEVGDVPYYPIRLVKEKKMLREYQDLADAVKEEVTFMGRLGTYRYLDMDVTIAEALKVAQEYLGLNASQTT